MRSPAGTVDDLDWPAMLSAAADGCGMRAVYQPIVDLASGTIAGYEALIRFVGYPVRSPVPWLRAAGARRRGAELQAAALRAALDHRGALPGGCFLSVNVAPGVLHHRAIREVWADEGDLHGLIVELTEPVADYASLEPDLDRLRSAGALIAVDDAGYHGLTQLSALRPTLIKLDRALVADIDTDEAKRALVETIGTIAARMDARLVAEGVERQGELDTLAALPVPLAQGYHLGRPARPWASLTGTSLTGAERAQAAPVRTAVTATVL